MEAILHLYRQAKALAAEPRSRFVLGSPCRWIPAVDFTVHFLIPMVLRQGDTSQRGRWDRGRLLAAYRLVKTSPRWQHLAPAVLTA